MTSVIGSAGTFSDFLLPLSGSSACEPFNEVAGAKVFVELILRPMYAALEHLHRRRVMLLGREYYGREWDVSHGYYVAAFKKSWVGIPPNADIVGIHEV